ncbi:cd9 antigen [Bulinus truncatus]|nr:cd9 antigen [Bulinus truncatus]
MQVRPRRYGQGRPLGIQISEGWRKARRMYEIGTHHTHAISEQNCLTKTQLLGCAILGVGIWLRVDENAAYYLKDTTHIDIFHTMAYVLIAIGFIIMVVGFLGCCGAIRENQCMLASFFILLFIIFAVLLGFGIWAAVAKDAVKEKIEESLEKGVKEYHDKESAKNFMDSVQTSLHCCGYKLGATDYIQSGVAPSSSCQIADAAKPCTSALYSWAESKLIIIAGVAIGIAVVLEWCSPWCYVVQSGTLWHKILTHISADVLRSCHCIFFVL